MGMQPRSTAQGSIDEQGGKCPLVSVIIPHYNDLEGLRNCLEHLRRQTWPEVYREIVIADNNSSCGVDMVRDIAPDARVVSAPEQGAGPARNAAVAHAKGNILALIDSDCVADPRWIEEGVEALRDYDYVGGQVRITVPRPQRPTPAEAFEMVFSFDFRTYIQNQHFSGTGNLFVPRDVFERVGGFRNGLSEDIEWCRRANALGYRLGYAERAIVGHPARREWQALVKRWDRVTMEMLGLQRESPYWVAKWLLYAAAVAISPFPHAVKVLLSDRLSGGRAKMAGLLGVFGIRLYRSYRMLVCLWDSRGAHLRDPSQRATPQPGSP